jgi:hypothetical protein
MSALLTRSSEMKCPHGGTVMAQSSSPDVSAPDGLLRISDTCTITLCTFATPAGPHPCTTVQWQVSATTVKADGDFVLNQSSVGFCLAADQTPQGTVLILSTQSKASGI